MAAAARRPAGATRAAKGKTKPPVLDPVRLHGLADAAAPHAPDTFDGLRFDGESFDGTDLQGSTFSECEFSSASMMDTGLRGARFLDCRFTGLYAPVFRAPRSTFRDVVLEGSRLGSAELYDGAWDSVHVDGGKLDFVNLRSSRLTNVLFSGCLIDELDLDGVHATRVAFRDCRIGSLNLSGAVLQDVDLRSTEFRSITHLPGLNGATVDEDQLMMLAPLLAANLGLRIEG
ncbi:pentapeptide repeat-containing protein [Arthrobacter jiangjiafuii]|uniref:Pentapeptide repeat-containing protein n=1 Tax=Arthrobacter jiangjiafuii TaxID=2817475 RepID=A0A975M590_9MICC|nr:pentapeptide repeat-containing protein [Arthrobacter jiangjiafuii]MBP3042083.1 pentapeptide repeat-containing protein [Arthrobacter jiangjiafuii]QWC10137.1 pentapeptide repeat-containing protein [Arthrobacter jiangjiafuii]